MCRIRRRVRRTRGRRCPPHRRWEGEKRVQPPVPRRLVPEREKYDGREDQSAELAGQGVTEVDQDGGERCRAEGYDEDRHQGTKGGSVFISKTNFMTDRGKGQAMREVSRAKGMKGSGADGRECRNNRS